MLKNYGAKNIPDLDDIVKEKIARAAVYEKLSEECPDKSFILLDDALVCGDMKLTTVENVLEKLEKLENLKQEVDKILI